MAQPRTSSIYLPGSLTIALTCNTSCIEFRGGVISILELIFGSIEPAFIFVLPFVWFEETPCAGIKACHKCFKCHILVNLLIRLGVISLMSISILVSLIGIEPLR